MANEPSTAPTTIDAYIAGFPEDVQERLQTMRRTIKAAAPDATESINYGVPTFQLNGNLVHFGASKAHIGFYPTPSGMTAFQDRFAGYKTAKGSVQFPNDQPLPLDLVTEIVRFRVDEQAQKKKR
jgi:uncharacterized protein YdhG (YjbR/CyaY superfamily)